VRQRRELDPDLRLVAHVHPTVPTVSAEGLLLAAGATTFLALGMMLLLTAFTIGPVSLASPFAASYPLVTAMIGAIVSTPGSRRCRSSESCSWSVGSWSPLVW
jgi:drug/metabolite transporter (DMT)-like permease